MTLLVNALGLAFIAFVCWHFWFAHDKAAPPLTALAMDGAQEMTIRVLGGYIPNVISAQPGASLRLHFRREEASACSDEIVFKGLGVHRALPAFETTTIELPALPTGTYDFACGMDMMKGRIVVGHQAALLPQVTPTQDHWPTDPICGMRVDPESPVATSVRDGVTYFFCAVSCRDTFERGVSASAASLPAQARIQPGSIGRGRPAHLKPPAPPRKDNA